MSSIIRTCSLLGSLLAAVSHAGPVAVRSSDVEVLSPRIPSIELGSYSLATSYEDDVLFNLGFSSSSGYFGETARLEIECLDCRTWGSAVVTTSGVSKDESILGDIISFFEDPVDTIMSAFDLDVKISFENVGGHFEFDISASDTVSYSFPIYESDCLTGLAVSEEVSVGLVLYIDLVFSLTAEIDVEAGFEFAFPDGAYITVDPLGGDIVDHSFTGGDVNNLPVTCTSGEATFKAALRVRVQAGTTVVAFGTGFDFELAVYADLIEYEASLTSTETCELLLTESLDCNIGAYAHAVVELDYKTFGVSPAVVTTILDYPLPSLCLTRPVATSILAFPTGTTVPLSIVTGTGSAFTGAYPTGTVSTSTGGIFFQGSSSTASIGTPTSTASGAKLHTPTGSIEYTTSTVLTTSVYTVTSCAPTVTNCPVGHVTTDIITLYTTVCPVSATSTNIGTATSTSTPSFSNSTGSSTITTSASLTTSTIYTTDLITVTSCSSTVLHCPASLASEIIITSTRILYTTVCPVGATQTLTTTPSSSPAPATASTVLVSPLPLTPCATPIVSTIYTPTLVNPTYTVPTATSFAIPYPNWNSTTTVYSTVIATPTVAKAVTTAPVSASSVSGFPKASASSNATVTKPSAATTFTGVGSRSRANAASSAMVVLLGAAMWVLA